MSNDLTRLRTKEELEIRKKIVLEITALLRRLNIRYFIQAGVLLGAVREKYFIPWDWDVEISVFTDEIVGDKFENLVNELRKEDFKILKVNPFYKNLKVDVSKYVSPESSSFTIYGWYLDKESKVYRRNSFVIPKEFISNLGKIEFLGEEFLCPSPVEKYLEFQFGNWREPKKSSDINEYCTKKFKIEKTYMQKKLDLFGEKIEKFKYRNKLKQWGLDSRGKIIK